MASHFSTIGFLINSEQEMLDIVHQASQEATSIPCSEGHYLKWQSPEGAQLWLQIDHDDNLVGLTPSFQGNSSFKVALINLITTEEDTPFEGMVYAWANPQDNKPESGDYPFVFDLVDKACYDTLNTPLTCEVELVAFAHELTLYDSEEEYEASQDQEPHFASESFIPSGLFGEGVRLPLPMLSLQVES